MLHHFSSLSGGVAALQPDQTETWDPGRCTCTPNRFFATFAAAAAVTDNNDEMSIDGEKLSSTRTELDSHANMPVVGRHAYIISYSGWKVDVRLFTPQYKFMEAELVDAALLYECPYEGKTHILVIRNAIQDGSMENNLIPLFILH